MPDTDDWYNLIENRLHHVITANSWLGTAGTAVKTREIKLRGDLRSYYDNELPAIAVKVMGKSQDQSASTDFQKFFKFTAYVLTREGDLDVAVNNVQEIMSQLENVLEAQYTAENDLGGLGTHSLVSGGPITRLQNTKIAFRAAGQDLSGWESLGQVTGEVELITN